MKTILLRAVIASLLFIPIQTFLNAQSSPPDAQLKGTLLDASGGGVGGVHVTAQLAADAQAPGISDGVVRIGVLTDMNGVFSDLAGAGAALESNQHYGRRIRAYSSSGQIPGGISTHAFCDA